MKATMIFLGACVAIFGCNAPAHASNSEAATIGGCIGARSAGRPWLVKTMWGLYDQARGWLGAEVPNSNGSHDLGPMQVNSAWVPVIARSLRRDPAAVRRWLKDDACFNVGVAAWLFLKGYAHYGADYWGAIGAYHSPTEWRARVYAHQVAARLRRRFGPRIFSRQGR